MAVETVYGIYTSAKLQRTPKGLILPQNYRGRVRCLQDSLELPALADIASVMYFGPIPMDATLMNSSRVGWDALGASTTLAFGVKDDTVLGISGKTAVFRAAASAAAASAMAAHGFGSVDIDKTGKRLWEILGLTSNPGGEAQLMATLAGAASTAGGTVGVDYQFAVD